MKQTGPYRENAYEEGEIPLVERLIEKMEDAPIKTWVFNLDDYFLHLWVGLGVHKKIVAKLKHDQLFCKGANNDWIRIYVNTDTSGLDDVEKRIMKLYKNVMFELRYIAMEHAIKDFQKGDR